MKRLLAAIKIDITVQARNKLYTIGIVASLLCAAAVAYLARPSQLSGVIPAVLLLLAGGTTMLYIAGMIIFEKDEGTLSAVIVSPLRPGEYLWAKIITLNLLAALESALVVGGAMGLMRFTKASDLAHVSLPNVPLLLLGVLGMGVFYTLLGIVMIVRYDKITDFLIPMAVVAGILQLPFLHFLGFVEHPAFLAIPSSAPALLIQGAFVSLPTWQWIYGALLTAAMIGGLAYWSQKAFHKHIIQRVG